MCTVSYYKSDEFIVITSNRDESALRPSAVSPQKRSLIQSWACYPIDPLHNGTWFAINQHKNILVLLNGAEKKHTYTPPYKKSRGLILLELIDSTEIVEKWEIIDLNMIENFTIICYFNSKLFKFQWDGNHKRTTLLDENSPHIWSSSTLYDDNTKVNREKWYNTFLIDRDTNLLPEDLFDFHLNTNNEDKYNGLIINRDNKMITKSITQTVLYSNHFIMKHKDLLNNETSVTEDIFV